MKEVPASWARRQEHVLNDHIRQRVEASTLNSDLPISG